MRDIRIRRLLPASRESVWAALTDRDALAEWLMPNDFEPRVGHRFTFRTDPAPGFDGTVHCEVLELQAPARLVIAWRGGPLDTIVRFTLEDHPDGTLLTVQHEGFRGLGNLVPRLILGFGWKKLLRGPLPATIARQVHGQ